MRQLIKQRDPIQKGSKDIQNWPWIHPKIIRPTAKCSRPKQETKHQHRRQHEAPPINEQLLSKTAATHTPRIECNALHICLTLKTHISASMMHQNISLCCLRSAHIWAHRVLESISGWADWGRPGNKLKLLLFKTFSFFYGCNTKSRFKQCWLPSEKCHHRFTAISLGKHLFGPVGAM